MYTGQLSGPQASSEPLISVVMPVYNAAEFLAEAVGSICNQTYARWELLCCDDGSTDGSAGVLQSLAGRDERIKALPSPGRQGVAAASNRALQASRGELIARMDADDIAAPDRLGKQLAYLIEHPETVAVGGQVTMIDRNGSVIGQKRFPTDPGKARRMMFVCMPIQQGAMLIHRARLPRDFTWYHPDAATAEEVELVFRFLQHGQLANLEDTVLRYRIHGGNLSLRNPKRTFCRTLKARVRAVRIYGYRPTLVGVGITMAQAVGVTLLPQRWIYPLYTLLRGMNTGKRA